MRRSSSFQTNSKPIISAPLTPADNFMISSSTGLVDSIPPTPVDIHGDNDLSVPSPNPAGVGVGVAGAGRGGGGGSGFLPHPPVRRAPALEMDDMIDSTVDSCGLSLVRDPGMEFGEVGSLI